MHNLATAIDLLRRQLHASWLRLLADLRPELAALATMIRRTLRAWDATDAGAEVLPLQAHRGRTMIYVTEPGHRRSRCRLGCDVLVQSLRSAGHLVTRVRLFQAQADADEQDRSSRATPERVVDHTWLAKPRVVRVRALRADVPRPAGCSSGWASRCRRRSVAGDPLIAFGGQATIAPETLHADFADIIALGDGELTGGRIAEMLAAGAGRLDIMRDLAGEPTSVFPRAESPVPADGESRGLCGGHDREGKTPTIELAQAAPASTPSAVGWAGGTYQAPQDQVKGE